MELFGDIVGVTGLLCLACYGAELLVWVAAWL